MIAIGSKVEEIQPGDRVMIRKYSGVGSEFMADGETCLVIDSNVSIPAKPTLSGYRELTADEVKLINVTKENAALVGELCDGIAGTPGVDQRWIP